MCLYFFQGSLPTCQSELVLEMQLDDQKRSTLGVFLGMTTFLVKSRGKNLFQEI